MRSSPSKSIAREHLLSAQGTSKLAAAHVSTIHNDRHSVDQTLMAMQEMERYCVGYPNTLVSLRHPRLFIRGRTFVALLGPSI